MKLHKWSSKALENRRKWKKYHTEIYTKYHFKKEETKMHKLFLKIET